MSEMIKRKDGSYSRRGLWDNIRANRGSGRKPTEQMLQQEKKIKAKMESGGTIPDRYRNMGFSRVGQKKASTNAGKKWMVLAKKGDQYKVVHGGYKGMQDFKQHGSQQRKANFWNRMGGRDSAKANDKFSPLYWHKRLGTWQDGGKMPDTKAWYESLIENLNPFNWFDSEETPTTPKLSTPAPKLSPKKQGVFTDEQMLRQSVMESHHRDDVATGKKLSPRGAKGLTQIMPSALSDFQRYNPGVKINLSNPEDAVRVQKWMLEHLSKRPYLNKPGQSENMTRAKVLGAYNWGPGNMKKFLEKQKASGADIYKSLDWVEKLPQEPRNYIKGILLNKSPEFQRQLQRDTVNSPYNKLYNFQQGGKFPYWNSLTVQEKKLAQGSSPIARALRMKAATGKVGQTAKEITGLVKDVEEVASELSGVPGTARFLDNPISNIKGAGKTILKAVGRNPYNPQGLQTAPQNTTPFNPKDTQKFFNTLDVAGLASSIAPAAITGTKAAARGLVKSLESGLLSNTHKINPWRFKPNPEASYRMLGTEGYADALESGAIRPKPGGGYDQPYFSKGEILDNYGGPYMAEIQGHPMVKNNMAFYSPHSDVVIPRRQITIDNPGLKFYKQDWLRGYKEIPTKENGGIITDSRGQWAHPGKITRIPGGDITMKGVNRPLLGISDKGQSIVMKPGKNYKFTGAKHVTEYPL